MFSLFFLLLSRIKPDKQSSWHYCPHRLFSICLPQEESALYHREREATSSTHCGEQTKSAFLWMAPRGKHRRKRQPPHRTAWVRMETSTLPLHQRTTLDRITSHESLFHWFKIMGEKRRKDAEVGQAWTWTLVFLLTLLVFATLKRHLFLKHSGTSLNI